MNEAESVMPFVLLGHGAGAVVTLQLVPQLQECWGERFRGFCISGVGFQLQPLRFALNARIAEIASSCCPMYIPHTGYNLKNFIREESWHELVVTDELRHQAGVPLTFMHWMFASLGIVSDREHLKQITCPFVYSFGTSDTTFNVEESMQLFSAIATPASRKIFQPLDDARHNVNADSRGSDFIEVWCQFVAAVFEGRSNFTKRYTIVCQ